MQHPAAARQRRDFVLEQLADQGRITAAASGDGRRRARLPKPEDVRLPGTQGPAPYFVNYVTDQLVAQYGDPKRVFGGGLEVTTTIDLELQEQAREAIEKVLKNPDGPAAALVAINPRTGGVKAMFGGTNFRRSQFNLATQAERQPGSSFKPIVLASAFRQGIAPTTRISSKPIEIDAGDRIWKVSNYEGTYLGEVDLARAMVSSDNSVYAQLTKIVGPKAIVDTARELGIRSELPAYFSIGLGAVAVNPLDMTRAYATIANDGQRVDGSITGDRPRVVRSVKLRRTGEVRQNEPVREPVLSKSEAVTITSILEQVVEQGTGQRADLADRTAAGKTGTTDDYGDAWFVGYTPELVVAVWVGYPNELRPMETEFNGEPVVGRHASRADLEGVHDEGARRRASAVVRPGAVPAVVRPARRLPRRALAARQRLLPQHPRHLVLRRLAAEVDRGVLRERGLRPAPRRALGGIGPRRPRSRCRSRRT